MEAKLFRAVFYNLTDHFSPDDIDADALDPEFRNWSDDELEGLDNYDLLALRFHSPDAELAAQISDHLQFANITFVVFIDADEETRRALEETGVDICREPPRTHRDARAFLLEMLQRLQESDEFDPRMADAFKLSAIEVFTTMASMHVEHIDTYCRPDHPHYSELNAAVRLKGRNEGVLRLSGPRSLFRSAIAGVLGRSVESIDDEMLLDGAGELANMIAGGAKLRLAEIGARFSLTTPTVSINHTSSLESEPEPCVVNVFSIDQQRFAVQACMLCLHR